MALKSWSTRHVAPLALLLGMLCAPVTVLAQASDGIIISVPDRFPEVNGGPFALVFAEADRSVIVLRRNRLNPQALEAALRVAAKAGRREIPTGQAKVDVVTGFAVRKSLPRERVRTLQRVIETLRTAPKSSLGALGEGRWVHWVPEGS
jgi:hypothetical protein